MPRVLGLALLLVACAVPPRASGTARGHETIVDGKTAPSVVSLTATQRRAVGAVLYDDDGWINECTGTLIAPKVVLTAAHCVVDDDTGAVLAPEEVRFAVGDDASHPTAVAAVDAVLPHPSYDPSTTTARYDVALLALATTLPSTTPLPLNCGALPGTLRADMVQVVGYGATADDDDNSKKLWAAEEVVALSSYDFTVDGGGESGVCYGDSGGPSLWTVGGEVRVIGVLSWGDEECAERDHFARTDGVCDFIDELVAPDEPGGCVLEDIDFDGGELACALDFVRGMSCEACDALFDIRFCEDAIDDAAACQRGPTCTGCGDGDGRDDGVDCAELAGFSYFGPTAAAVLHDQCD